MNNKAFTLIELLGVIVILVVLSLLIVPAVTTVLDNGEDTIYQSQINSILNSAYDFSLKNTEYLPDKNNTSYITLAQLKIEGYLDINIIDPTTSEKFSDDLVVAITNVGNNYSTNTRYAKTKGGYLYTVRIEDTVSVINKPTITIAGLTKNSDGNYIETININDTYTEKSVSSTTFENVNITNKIKKYITKNDVAVSSIDTTSAGIYNIYYVVVDDQGRPNQTILKLIVQDNERPSLTIPGNSTISTSINSFDLMNGVSCVDNSNHCSINYEDTIKYHTAGKYTITYTATDPSGNTTTEKRIITVE